LFLSHAVTISLLPAHASVNVSWVKLDILKILQ
jgi:hypothetical protein